MQITISVKTQYWNAVIKYDAAPIVFACVWGMIEVQINDGTAASFEGLGGEPQMVHVLWALHISKHMVAST